MKARQTSGETDRGCPNRRAMLMRWADSGGSLPGGLTDHLTTCPKCHKWAARIVRVHGALALLTTEASPIGLLGRANDKALRMLARTLRESETAVRLRRARPSLGLWPKIEGPLGRAAAAAAAAVVILSLRAGVASGIKQTCDLAQPLADLHYQRHINDPKLLS